MTWIADSSQGRREQLGTFLLGAGGIGGIAGATGPGLGLSDTEGLALLDRAVDEGIKVVDTADMYTGGNSERVVGAWNRAHPDAGVFIQTKTGITPDGPDLSPDRVARQLEHSIAVLGRVDLYVAHQVDPDTLWSASLPVFSGAVENGTIRAYGLSNVDAQTLTAALETADRLGLVRPELVQNQHSLIARGDDKDMVPLVHSEGLVYTPFSPPANGLLAGRYSKGERPVTGSRASIASGSAMAVEILERDLGVPVRNLEQSDIAYDVHIRRVFLRARLADRDDRDHMITVARRLHPARPGALDLPTWLIGRGWCHPGVPDCASCPLTKVCPKEIERAAHVHMNEGRMLTPMPRSTAVVPFRSVPSAEGRSVAASARHPRALRARRTTRKRPPLRSPPSIRPR